VFVKELEWLFCQQRIISPDAAILDENTDDYRVVLFHFMATVPLFNVPP